MSIVGLAMQRSVESWHLLQAELMVFQITTFIVNILAPTSSGAMSGGRALGVGFRHGLGRLASVVCIYLLRVSLSRKSPAKGYC